MAGSSADSRVSSVGRKRDLANVAHYREAIVVDDSSDGESVERSRKRVKQQHVDLTGSALDEDRPIESAFDRSHNDEEIYKALVLSAEVKQEEELVHTHVDGGASSVSAKELGEVLVESPSVGHNTGSESAVGRERGTPHTSTDVRLSSKQPDDIESLQASLSNVSKPPQHPESKPKSSFTPINKVQISTNPEIQLPIITSATISQQPLGAGALPRVAPIHGWNKGVQSGLRVSFGENLLKVGPTPISESKRLAERATVDDAQSSYSSSSDSLPVIKSGQSVPPVKSSSQPEKHQILSHSKIRKLPLAEQSAAKKAARIGKRIKKLEKNTREADSALAQGGPMLLKDDQSIVSHNIKEGMTYYAARSQKLKFATHYIRGAGVRMVCLLDPQGMPIKAQDFNFKMFSTALLRDNPLLLQQWNGEDFRQAFQSYCSNFYGHAPDILPQILETGNVALAEARPNQLESPNLELDSRLPSTAIEPPARHRESSSSAVKRVHHDIEMSDTLPLEHISRKSLLSSLKSDSAFEISLEQKYFPTSGNNALIRLCLACANIGHSFQDCPALMCDICGENGKHSNFTCPDNARCGKCRKSGHQISNCPEKLFATKAESTECNICRSMNHVETSCHFIWRSFAPKDEEIRKVRSIPIYCYTCGAEGHYGPECGLHTTSLFTGGYTWSTSMVQKYVDPDSQDRAVSAGIDYSIPKRQAKEFSIKGKGRVNDPFTIEDSEGDGEFIRPKINNVPNPRGQIHFGGPSSVGHPMDEGKPYRPQHYQDDNMTYNLSEPYAKSEEYRQKYYDARLPAVTSGVITRSGNLYRPYLEEGQGHPHQAPASKNLKKQKKRQKKLATSTPSLPKKTKKAKRRERAAMEAAQKSRA